MQKLDYRNVEEDDRRKEKENFSEETLFTTNSIYAMHIRRSVFVDREKEVGAPISPLNRIKVRGMRT